MIETTLKLCIRKNGRGGKWYVRCGRSLYSTGRMVGDPPGAQAVLEWWAEGLASMPDDPEAKRRKGIGRRRHVGPLRRAKDLARRLERRR